LPPPHQLAKREDTIDHHGPFAKDNKASSPSSLSSSSLSTLAAAPPPLPLPPVVNKSCSSAYSADALSFTISTNGVTSSVALSNGNSSNNVNTMIHSNKNTATYNTKILTLVSHAVSIGNTGSSSCINHSSNNNNNNSHSRAMETTTTTTTTCELKEKKKDGTKKKKNDSSDGQAVVAPALGEKVRKKRRMTKEEDEILKRAVIECEKNGIELSWKVINKEYFNNKYDSNFLYQRWNRVLKCTRRQEWTDNEALELLYYVQQYGGTRWTQIRQAEYDCHFSDTTLANAYKTCLRNANATTMLKTLSKEEILRIINANKLKRASWEKPKEFLQLQGANTTDLPPVKRLTRGIAAKKNYSQSTSTTPQTYSNLSSSSSSSFEQLELNVDKDESNNKRKRNSAASRFVSSKRRRQEKVDTKYSGNNMFDQLVDLFVSQDIRSKDNHSEREASASMNVANYQNAKNEDTGIQASNNYDNSIDNNRSNNNSSLNKPDISTDSSTEKEEGALLLKSVSA
jgi:hypothetical protein